MSSISLPTPDVQFITNSFNYILTEMSNLSPEKLQLLARLFQLQAAKYNHALMITQIAAASSLAIGGLFIITAINIRNADAQIGLFVGGAIFFIVGLIMGLAYLIIMRGQNEQLSWYNRCIELIELNTQIA